MCSGWNSEIAALEAPSETTQRGVRVHIFGRDTVPLTALARLGRSRAMAGGLAGLGGDILHTHGLWMMPNVYPARLARQKHLPLVLAPRGMLGVEALKFSYSAKRAFWAIWQARAVKQVSCFHATAESELEDIRAFGLKAPVAIVPNGVDLPACPAPSSETNIKPFVLSLGRLHPKKGLESLIAAFGLVSYMYPDWRLRIVGIDEGGYSATLRRAIAQAGLEDRATVEGPVYNSEKTTLMANAALFALPSLHENFGMTVAESLAVGTPVISTKGAPWQGLAKHSCGWWIEHGTQPLASTLVEAMSMSPAERRAMGARGRAWMKRDFAWEGVGLKMGALYNWLLIGGSKPDFVRID